MSIKTWFGMQWAHFRANRIHLQGDHATDYRAYLFEKLLWKGKRTAFGREHHLHEVANPQEFRQAVPVREYEGLAPWIDRIVAGEKDILWPGRPLYLAKTSGTTAGAKYIPLTRHQMQCQVRGARDALLLYMAATGRPQFLDGKMLFLSGSPEVRNNEAGIPVGRLSGIANHFVPAYLQRNRLPSYSINCLEDWESKLDGIIQEARSQDLRLISGIPPWVQMFFERAEERTGQRPLELWPNLQVFVEGGVDYAPYAPVFEKALGGAVDVWEVYPASEGFVAVQDSLDELGMRLMLDYGIWHEFIPLEDYGKPNAPRLGLEQVEVGRHYALVLNSTAGLWGYSIGDTVKFESLNPPRLKVTGRVKHFISAFGEHVISEEVEQAMMAACKFTGAVAAEFTVAPYISDERSYHEWLVEFEQEPPDLQAFVALLDRTLQDKNVYYKDLRDGNMLTIPVLTRLQAGASRSYMKAQGRLGGQNKFPRLANDRRIADQLTPYRVPSTP